MMRRLMLTLALLTIAAPAGAQTAAALLDTLQYTAFQYFWNEANPANGLIRDRSTTSSPASIAAVGFGLSAIAVGADHGWVSRADAAERVRTTLRTFWYGPQGSAVSGTIGYRGFFYHFLDMATATRMVSWDTELSSIDTALLFAGVLDAKQYFEQNNATENEIRWLADSLYYRADWNFMRNNGSALRMGWKPVSGFLNFGEWIGYNEAMILYLLALGSPSRPGPASLWNAWTSGYDWDTLYGQSYVVFPPLFGHQYSHCWVDFRGLKDTYMSDPGRNIDYFENSRRATLAQRAYSIENPGGFVAYSDSLWGITASDVPSGYMARGAPPPENDNGTITPTAPISSLPFTPDESMAVIQYLWNHYRPQLWGPYGWRDAFNPTQNWYGPDVIGIDQGPIILMIENHLNGAVWQRMMRNPDIQRGLQRAGFTGLVAVGDPPPGEGPTLSLAGPNPFRTGTAVRLQLARAAEVRVTLFDPMGRRVATLAEGRLPPGGHVLQVPAGPLGAGLYLVGCEADGRSSALRLVHLP
jgi:hypothetical protein